MNWIEHERSVSGPASGFFQPASQPKSPGMMDWIEHERSLSNPGHAQGPVDTFQPSVTGPSQPMYFDCMIRNPQAPPGGGVGGSINFLA